MRESIELVRRRAPVITEAIHIVGGILICLCPVLLAAYVLYSVNRIPAAEDDQILNEILIGELTREMPRLLSNPMPSGRTIADQRSTESAKPIATAANEPPF